MAGILFDTSIYITAFRSGELSLFSQRSFKLARTRENVPLWLSVVVLEELYVGAGNAKVRKSLEKLENDFDKANRLLVPLQIDWTSAGKILNKIGEKHGFEQVGKARLTNDTLIAMTAARTGMTLISANAKDFAKISAFRAFEWRLA
ncbi:MAG: PIN domain-containing protein [Pyrinomonadaceae bacterium]